MNKTELRDENNEEYEKFIYNKVFLFKTINRYIRR
jgi:hypothetical protein